MSQSKHYETAPEDRIPFVQKLVYGVGAFINNLLAAASGGMMIVLNLGLGMNPALVGLLGALPRLTDALIDPIMGFVSDHTRSRWGRRRPYIFLGAIASGITFALLWQLPAGKSETFYFLYFLFGSILFYVGYTVFAAPWVALGYELTPDYHERTRLMGVQNFIGQLAYVVSPWFLWIMTYKGFFQDQVSGAAGLAIIIGVVTIGFGILPAIFLRERFKDIAVAEAAERKGTASAGGGSAFLQQSIAFFKGFGATLKSGPFLKLCLATFLVFNGFILVSSFQLYVIIYYVTGGDQALGAKYAGYAGTVGAIGTFVVIILVTWLGTKIGKRRAFFISTAVSIVGYGLKWICYNPKIPLLVVLPAPLLAFGLGGLFTLIPSMVADVVDVDELKTHQRREGMYSAIFWWVVKMGMAAALAGGGFLLNATGFDIALGMNQAASTIFLMRLCDAGIPMVASAIAIWAVARFPITEQKAHEVRLELERRRGTPVEQALPIPQQESEILRRLMVQKSIAEKVEALLARMDLNQKIGQMIQTERMAISPAEVKAYHLGSVLSGGGSRPGNNTPADWVAMNDAYWAASMEEDEAHLAIPILYGVDAIHGHNNVRGATVFPHNIGLGAAHDPDLIERIARITAREILATGVEWTFAPTLAVARNDHWGRTYESYSEDPEIVCAYAGRFVTGLQGDLGQDSVIACAKHWVGDGGTTRGVDQGETTVSLAELERIHIAPYYPAINAGVLTVMASYNSWNGNKCHGHYYLLTELLKKKMGFKGFIISDWNGTDQLAQDFAEAVALGANAGIDMFMVPEKWKLLIETLRAHVQQGIVSVERIDDAVRRILTVKFAYGLFEKPRPAARYWSNQASFGSKEHREVAREAVRKSLVLLQNRDAILPIAKNARILVAGKNADNRGHQCGGFTIEWQGTSGNGAVAGGTSIWEGIREVAPAAVLSVDGAAAETEKFDVALVVIGERPYAEGLGDVRDDDKVALGSGMERPGLVLKTYATTLELAVSHPEDLQTIRRISAQGIPVVAILVSGRPLVVNRELEQASAFVAAWLPGSEGQGVADVIFGDHDFQGKLSFSWPRAADDNWNRGEESYNPLFPFGYGLSYRKIAAV
ncbi:MAG: Beta-hexosaminidase [bacterium]|nr:Beta-hexosaminidase [bacterium]